MPAITAVVGIKIEVANKIRIASEIAIASRIVRASGTKIANATGNVRRNGSTNVIVTHPKRKIVCISNQKRVCAGSISQSRDAPRRIASSSTGIKKKWAGDPQNSKKIC